MRFPWTIWRYAMLELGRLLLLTTGALVVVVSFAATVKPLAAGRLGPLDTLRFMVLAIPPMLQYALPFAGGFAATLAYHRMAQDNELTAARAGGIGHASLAVPAILSGLLVALVLSLLSQALIPRFLRSMEDLITRDATRMLVRSIERGESVRLADRFTLLADSAKPLGPDPDSGAYERLLLSRVAVMRTDAEGRPTTEAFADQAWVWLIRRPGSTGPEGPAGDDVTQVEIVLRGAQAFEEGKGGGGAVESRISQTIPGAFRDDPKFLTARELARLPRRPDAMSFIDSRRRTLARELARAQAIRAIGESLALEGRVRLRDDAGRLFTINASGLRPEGARWRLLPLDPGSPSAAPAGSDRPVEVELLRPDTQGGYDDTSIVRFHAAQAHLERDDPPGAGAAGPAFALGLDGVRTEIIGAAEATEAAGGRLERRHSGLTLRETSLPALLTLDSPRLLIAADAWLSQAGPEPGVEHASRDLRQRLERLEREVLSKRHERLAMTAACLVMVVAGALTAMRLGACLPLAVYLWSFFPALAAVLTISAGQQLVHQVGAPGLALLWGGVVLVGAYALGAFLVVSRH